MQTIEEVIVRLTEIVSESVKNQSPMGYFASLYRRMTIAVRDGMRSGRFTNPAAVEKLDVAFAKRYIEAYENWQAGRPPTRAWQRAFEATQRDQISLIQHWLMGINAHIGLDLGIAAAETAPREAIFSTENDFLEINKIIGELTEEVEEKMAKVWWVVRRLDALAKTADERFTNFTIRAARGIAWQAALQLAFLEDAARTAFINELDAEVAAISSRMEQPPGVLGFVLKTIRWGETGSVVEKIELLG